MLNIKTDITDLTGFKEFMIENKVLTFAASFAFAQTIYAFIQSLVSDILMPSIYLLFSLTVFKLSKKSSVYASRFLPKTLFNVDHFIQQIIISIAVLGSAYLIIDYSRRVFLKQQKTQQKKQ